MAPKRRASNELPNTRQGNQIDFQRWMNRNYGHDLSLESYADPNYDNGHISNQNRARLSTQQYEQPPLQSQYGQPPLQSQYGQPPLQSLYGQPPFQSHYGHTHNGQQEFSNDHNSEAGLSPAVSNEMMPRNRKSPSGAGQQKPKSKQRTRDKAGRVTKGSPKQKEPPELNKPLSEIEMDFPDVELEDIESLVQRSSEVRQKEKEKNPGGRNKRPMNPFMLYRKRYQVLAKAWCSENNHQILSKVCGISWHMESRAVKQRFRNWAKGEKENHLIADPFYRHSPQKKAKKALGAFGKGKRKDNTPDDVSDDMSDSMPDEIDDPLIDADDDLHEYDWREATIREKIAQQPAFGGPQVDMAGPPSYGGQEMSTYGYSNPGMMPPDQYDESSLHDGQYFEQTVQQGRQLGVEDVTVRRTVVRDMSHVAVPGRQQYIMTDHHKVPYDTPSQNIDPSLLSENVYSQNTDFGDFGVFAEMYNFGGKWEVEEQAEENPSRVGNE